MKKRRIKLGLLALLIAGSITFGIMYIPEKPCDSFNDLAEISDYIADYIGDYLDHDIPHTNQRLNKMVESIAVVTVYPQRDEVEVAIVDCTFWKKQLFKREIINSKYIKFVDSKGVMND